MIGWEIKIYNVKTGLLSFMNRRAVERTFEPTDIGYAITVDESAVI